MYTGHFTVIDTETTGLFPGGHHRVAEVAIVTLDRSGKIVDRWETLVNPGRDLGKQSIHNIRARDVLQAPSFADIAEELAWRLSGNVVAAHNLAFDARFLSAEFQRAGVSLPESYLPRGLCTMRMSHTYLPGAGRSLRDCCDSFSIDLGKAHCAGDDAEAAAVLLSRYMELDGGMNDWDRMLDKAEDGAWLPIGPSSTVAPALRSAIGNTGESHFLERIVVGLPEFTGPTEHEQYLALLDLALLDRHLSAHEEALLVETANELGIGQQQVAELHTHYFEQLVGAAWADGVLTDTEIADLDRVAGILRIDARSVEAARTRREPGKVPGEARTTAESTLLQPGDLVVLTGDMTRPRNVIEQALADAGYISHSAVTKKVKLLVAADPDSLSGKARKARDYGIPVVGENYLWDTVLSSGGTQW